MSNIKKKSVMSLSDGINKFENSRNAVRNSDYTDLNTFIKDFLNTSEPKQRCKLAEEFKKRHLELYDFIKENSQLIAAETEISRTIQAALSGEEQAANNNRLTNLLKIIEESSGEEK